MKTYKIVLVLLVGILTGCGPTSYVANFYQIAQTKVADNSNLIPSEDGDGFYYKDANCIIRFDFWSEGGISSFVVQNLTNDILYIDLDKSFLVKDGTSYDYWRPIAIQQDNHASYLMPKNSQPIAPKASRSFTGVGMGFEQYYDCDLSLIPKKNQPVTLAFSQEDSPASFRNVLTYHVGNQESTIRVESEFYISRVTNYRSTDLLQTKDKDVNVCPNKLGSGITYTAQYKQFYFSPATGFYVTYQHIVTE